MNASELCTDDRCMVVTLNVSSTGDEPVLMNGMFTPGPYVFP